MDYDIDDPDYPAKKKRKKRGEPRLDFSDPQVKMWMEMVWRKHNEIFDSVIDYLALRCLARLKNLPIDTFTVRLEPGKPKLTGKNLRQDEWDAWLYYYCEMQDRGMSITPQDIANLTGRDLITVNSAFKAAKRRIEILDVSTFVSEFGRGSKN